MATMYQYNSSKIAQTYLLASKVKAKLTQEAIKSDVDLHRLVCQANLLDNLIEDLNIHESSYLMNGPVNGGNMMTNTNFNFDSINASDAYVTVNSELVSTENSDQDYNENVYNSDDEEEEDVERTYSQIYYTSDDSDFDSDNDDNDYDSDEHEYQLAEETHSLKITTENETFNNHFYQFYSHGLERLNIEGTNSDIVSSANSQKMSAYDAQADIDDHTHIEECGLQRMHSRSLPSPIIIHTEVVGDEGTKDYDLSKTSINDSQVGFIEYSNENTDKHNDDHSIDFDNHNDQEYDNDHDTIETSNSTDDLPSLSNCSSTSSASSYDSPFITNLSSIVKLQHSITSFQKKATSKLASYRATRSAKLVAT